MLYQRSHSQHDNGVIFLGVDESNYLLDADYEGQANKRSFLKETMIAVASTLLSDIVPVVELSYITISNNTICKTPPILATFINSDFVAVLMLIMVSESNIIRARAANKEAFA